MTAFGRLASGSAQLAIVAVAAVACDDAFEDKRLVDAWLGCDECVEAELARVDSLATERPGWVTDYLAEALHGPSAHRRTNMALQFAESWQRVQASGASPGLTEPDYVRLHVENYAATSQLRAARALARIGSREAVVELTRASENRSIRPDVRDYVAGLVSLLTLPASGAVASTSTADFGDTIRIEAPPGGFRGSETIRLAGQPESVDHVVERWGFDSLAFVANALPGMYVVLLRDPGPPVLETRLEPELTIRRLISPPRTFDGAPELTVDRSVFVPLSGWINSEGGDAARGTPIRRLRVSGDEVTAVGIVAWEGRGSLQMVWTPHCDVGLHSDTATVAGNILSDAGQAIPGAIVELDQPHGGSAVTDPDGWFSLDGLASLYGDTVDLRVSFAPGPSSLHRAAVGANELLLVHRAAGVVPDPSTRADTSATYLDELDCKTLRILPLDSLPRTILARASVLLEPNQIGAVVPADDNLQLPIGRERQLALSILDQTGQSVSGLEVRWFSTNPDVASISSSGFLRAEDVGSTTIVIVAGLERATISVDVVQ